MEGWEKEGDCNLTPASHDTKMAQYPPGFGKWDQHDIYLEFLGKNFPYGAVEGPCWALQPD